MNLKKAQELGEACLDEMYKASDPPTTWAKIKKKYTGTKTQFFLKHEITLKDYERIKSKYAKRMGSYARDLDWLLLDYSPKFNYKDSLMKKK